jgi:dTDP-4-amino-4,6-dideoxygalactose transaminase
MTTAGQCPVAEDAYTKIISLPIFQGLSFDKVDYVIECVKSLFKNHV